MPKIINVYLSGPMNKTWEDATRWRNDVISGLNEWALRPENRNFVQFNFLNPCNRWFIDRKELYELDNYKWVIKIDKMEIEKSNIVIVNATDNGWGTPMEQYIAYSAGKLVLAFCEKDRDHPIWAKEHSHVFRSDRFQIVDWLCNHAKEIAVAL